MNDLKDIEYQLMAIDDWLETLEERVRVDHHGMCSKELGQARARITAAREQLEVRRAELAELCKLAKN